MDFGPVRSIDRSDRSNRERCLRLGSALIDRCCGDSGIDIDRARLLNKHMRSAERPPTRSSRGGRKAEPIPSGSIIRGRERAASRKICRAVFGSMTDLHPNSYFCAPHTPNRRDGRPASTDADRRRRPSSHSGLLNPRIISAARSTSTCSTASYPIPSNNSKARKQPPNKCRGAT